MDRGAWWATVHGVAQSWTRLKQLSIALFFPIIIILLSSGPRLYKERQLLRLWGNVLTPEKTRCFGAFCFLASPCSMWDLIYPTGDRPCAPCSGSAQDHWGSPASVYKTKPLVLKQNHNYTVKSWKKKKKLNDIV